MAIDVTIQHNGGFLPDIILLTQCYYHRGTRLNVMKGFCICSLRSHLNVLTFFPLTGGRSEGLDAFRYLFKLLFCISVPMARCNLRPPISMNCRYLFYDHVTVVLIPQCKLYQYSTRAPDAGAWGPPVLRGECE